MPLRGVHRLQVRIDAIEADDRRQLVAQAGEREVRARRDELVDLRGREVVHQVGHVVVDAVPRQALVLDQRVEVREAVDVDADLHALVERREIPRRGRAHRHAERGQSRRIDVGTLQEHVHGAQAVVDHHPPEDLALQQHRLEHVEFGGVAALAEDPGVDADGDVAEVGQRLGVRRRLQVAAALDELRLADLVAAAVRVAEDDAGRAAGEALRAGDVARDRLDAVQVVAPGLEDVAVALDFPELLARHRARAVGQPSEQAVQLGPARGG